MATRPPVTTSVDEPTGSSVHGKVVGSHPRITAAPRAAVTLPPTAIPDDVAVMPSSSAHALTSAAPDATTTSPVTVTWPARMSQTPVTVSDGYVPPDSVSGRSPFLRT